MMPYIKKKNGRYSLPEGFVYSRKYGGSVLHIERINTYLIIGLDGPTGCSHINHGGRAVWGGAGVSKEVQQIAEFFGLTPPAEHAERWYPA